MEVIQSVSLDECLSEVLDPNTTPEKVLQALSSSSFSPDDRERASIVIFLVHMRFIVSKHPHAHVDGIWEELLIKTVVYSQNISYSGDEIGQVRRMFATKVPINCFKEIKWLNIALSTKSNCPNPYTRLKVFHLLRIFRKGWIEIHWPRICAAYVHTISEIQPNRLHRNGGRDEILFDFLDFKYIFYKCYEHGKMIRVSEEGMYDNKAKCISHFLQLLGIYAISASLLPDSKSQIDRLNAICRLFDEMAGLFNSYWKQYRYIIAYPYVAESVRDITAAIINNKQEYKDIIGTVKIRDNIVEELDLCTKHCNLPKLLLSRQIQGSVPVRQHTLLVRNLRQFYENISDISDVFNRDYEEINDEDSEDEDDDEEDSDDDGSNDEEMDEEEINVEENYFKIDPEESEVEEGYVL